MPFQTFSNLDIKKLIPDFDSKRLTEWRHKEYIRNLINKWYLFEEATNRPWLIIT